MLASQCFGTVVAIWMLAEGKQELLFAALVAAHADPSEIQSLALELDSCKKELLTCRLSRHRRSVYRAQSVFVGNLAYATHMQHKNRVWYGA